MGLIVIYFRTHRALLMDEKKIAARFEKTMLPHLPAAYNLALWIMRNPQDAEDVVQSSYLKAFKAFKSFSDDNAHAWILKIVRNTCMTLLKRNKNNKVVRLDASPLVLEDVVFEQYLLDGAGQPEINAIVQCEQASVQKALSRLPVKYREVIILREFEDMQYQQIADVIGVPIGTVMSRLSRARKHFAQLMTQNKHKRVSNEL